ncbi:hypothetical protein BJ546DRAFT_434674 [Cryomyces antarcticus]
MIRRGREEGWLKLPITALKPWAALNGVFFNGIEIGPLPGHEERGSTVIAQKGIAGDDTEPLMVVPRDFIVSLEAVQEHAKLDRDFKEMLDAIGDFGRTARGAILLFLLTQSSISSPDTPTRRFVSGPFTDYIKFLPAELLPTLWTDSERALLTGTTLKPAVEAKLKALYREYDALRASTAHIVWCEQEWWHEVDGLVRFEDWLAVDAMYRSRALEFPGVGDCMVPCVDMANHSSGDSTTALYECDSHGDGVLLLREGKTLEEGDEVTITYGDKKGACEMVFLYGFLEDTMEDARESFLDLEFPDDDPLKRAKEVVTRSAPGFKLFEKDGEIGWEGEYVWLICVNEEDGLEFRVAQANDGTRELRVSWKEQELENTERLRDLLKLDAMWDVYQLRAVSVLQSRVEAQLRELYGSDDEVIATDHGDGSEVRDSVWNLTTRLRKLESALLDRAYSAFEDQKAKLVDSETVRRYLGSAGAEEIVEDFS